MDFSALSNNTLSAASAPASGNDPTANSAGPGAGSSAFSGVLQSLLPPQERQDIAAPEASGKAEMAFLSAQTPGMQLEIITAATPVPGEDSLAAFARNQGLNESAIQALFGPAAWFSAANAGLGQAPQQTTPAVAETPSADMVSPPLNDFFALWSLGAAPGSTLAAAQAASTASSVGQAPLGSPNAAQNAAMAVLSAQGLTTDKTLSTLEEGVFSIQKLVIGQTQPTPDEMARLDEATAVQLRLAVQPHSLTTRLMNMKGTDVAQNWSQLMTTVNSPQAGKTEEMVLEIGPELLQALETHDLAIDNDTAVPHSHPMLHGDGAAKTAASQPTLTASPALPSADPQQRAEHIQQLADKMGQALADRLQQQIAKGEWSLQLRMNPAQLGQVDVSLDMSAAGLDAVFQSDNALTRELIALGSNKLKDSLTQSGMTVASVWVNSGGERQAGGNPTQQQKQQPSHTKATAETAGPEIRSSHSRIMRPDGWDVLA